MKEEGRVDIKRKGKQELRLEKAHCILIYEDWILFYGKLEPVGSSNWKVI